MCAAPETTSALLSSPSPFSEMNDARLTCGRRSRGGTIAAAHEPTPLKGGARVNAVGAAL